MISFLVAFKPFESSKSINPTCSSNNKARASLVVSFGTIIVSPLLISFKFDFFPF